MNAEDRRALPGTIENPDAFLRCLPPWFDGVVDWEWVVKECKRIGSSITPTDIDGIVERRGNFLVIEHKSGKAVVKIGQARALRALWRLGCFTIVLVWSGSAPTEEVELWWPPSFERAPERCTGERAPVMAAKVFSRWLRWAKSNPSRHWSPADPSLMPIHRGTTATALDVLVTHRCSTMPVDDAGTEATVVTSTPVWSWDKAQGRLFDDLVDDEPEAP